MNLHVHHLAGCRPAPLAHYLKALGVLRLTAQQTDASVRGWWKGESFYLATRLDEEGLLRFFLDDYRPTPLLAPWNGGSGFYPKSETRGIEAVRGSAAPRLAAYRDALRAATAWVAGLDASPKGKAKNALLRRARRTWRGPALEWLDAAVVLTAEGEAAYPALLGTGGNDGRLDFTNNFMQRLADLFAMDLEAAPARPNSSLLLRAAIFGEVEQGMSGGAVGQFLPGGAGGANQSSGFTGPSSLNPWDFVLMLEGALVFRSGLARRAQVQALPQAAAPFAVVASAAGSGSTAEGEKNRGEQWMPLWEGAATLGEIQAMVSEGRAQLQKRPSRRSLDFGRAIARLGVARGVSAFERFGFIERNGQANLAVPLGRWPVRAQPHQDLLEQVAGWVDRLRRAGAVRGAPASASRAARNCEETMLACCRHGANPRRWQALLVALGEAEAQLPRSPRFTAANGLQPLPTLSAAWFTAAEGGVEVRLALALASQHGPLRREREEPAQHPPEANETPEAPRLARPDWNDPIRRHFLPLDLSRRRFEVHNDAVAAPAELVADSGDLASAAIGLVRRRVVEAGQRGDRCLPLVPVPGLAASLRDIERLLDGRVDDQLILALARPLMALEWSSFRARPRRPGGGYADAAAVATYALFRLAMFPGQISVPGPDERSPATAVEVPLDPAIFTSLSAGDLPRAAQLAVRRLTSSGLRPHLRTVVGPRSLARRIALAIAFPIDPHAASALARRLIHTMAESSEAYRSEPLQPSREEHELP